MVMPCSRSARRPSVSRARSIAALALAAEAAVRGGAGDGVELVGEDRLRVVQEPAHQGGLAVVDGAGGGEAEQGRRQ